MTPKLHRLPPRAIRGDRKGWVAITVKVPVTMAAQIERLAAASNRNRSTYIYEELRQLFGDGNNVTTPRRRKVV